MNNASAIINKATINLRTDGRYECRLTFEGKRKSFYGKTKVEVKQKIKEYLYKIENGYKEPQNIVFNDYIEYWLKTYKLNKIEPSSYTRLYRIYKCQIKNGIGEKKIGSITTKDIQKLIDEYANPTKNTTKPLAMSGLKRLLQLFNACMCMAVKENIIHENPCNNVILPKSGCVKKETIKQVTMSDDEIKLFKEKALEKYKNGEYRTRDGLVTLIILSLGLRAGEMLALEWEDINIESRLVYINKTVQTNNIDFDSNKIYERIKDSTKTNHGRILKLNDSVIWCINELREYDRRNNITSKYVCCSNIGTRKNYRNLARSLERIVGKTYINKNITLHTLRHTFGSTMLRKGVGVEVVSKLLGHANIMITYNKYIHVIQEQEAKAMNMVQIC